MNWSKEPWQQGQLLDTAQTRLWTPEQRAAADQQERLMFFRGFTSEDQGRSREHIGHCRYADDVLRIVACVNAMAGKDPAAYVATYNEMLEFVRVSTRGLTKKKNPLLARAEAARNE